MKENMRKYVPLIDKLIYVFTIIFVVSLTNSIFVNQIGYFGALLLILIRYFITRENQFEKTGLEIAFAVFILAEIISTILSIDHTQALRNLSKRFLLIPIVYTMIIAADDPKKAKLFFKLYIGVALLTVAAYIAFAYEHFVSRLYQIEYKGPSPFQYVMTAGGLMSFTTIFLFAFLVNEKRKILFRILIGAAFVLVALGLGASYTRAAWMGAGAGIFTVIILKRKWIIVVPIIALLLFALFYFKNESKLNTYKIDGGKLTLVSSQNTNGRAWKIYSDSTDKILADYENGFIQYDSDGTIKHQIKTPAPAVEIDKWTDGVYFGQLIDSRILLMKKDVNGNLTVFNELLSPGRTVEYKIANNFLYICDIDSGITIYKDPYDQNNKIYLHNLNKMNSMGVDSSFLACFSNAKDSLYVYNLSNGLPVSLAAAKKEESSVGNLWVVGNDIWFQSSSGFEIYNVSGGEFKLVSNYPEIIGITRIHKKGDELFYAAGVTGDIVVITRKDNKFIFNKYSLGYTPADINQADGKIFVAFNKRNRLTSFVDPYHDTNIERVHQWETGYRIFKDHPLFGIGDIDIAKTYSKYKAYFEKENFGHLHNNYVQFFVILGLFGFIAVMFMLVKIVLLNKKIFSALKDVEFASSYSLGAFAAFIGFLVSGLAEWNFGDQEIITMVWFTVGLNYAFYKNYVLNKTKTAVKTDNE